MSAVGTRSAVVCNAKLPYCRRVVGIVALQREQASLALQSANSLSILGGCWSFGSWFLFNDKSKSAVSTAYQSRTAKG